MSQCFLMCRQKVLLRKSQVTFVALELSQRIAIADFGASLCVQTLVFGRCFSVFRRFLVGFSSAVIPDVCLFHATLQGIDFAEVLATVRATRGSAHQMVNGMGLKLFLRFECQTTLATTVFIDVTIRNYTTSQLCGLFGMNFSKIRSL